MQRNKVSSFDFQAVFDGIDPHAGIPNTDLLTQLPLRDGHHDVLSYLSGENSELLQSLFVSIEHVCDSVGLIPLILDVALLRDDREAKREAPENFYVSVVKISTEHPDAVWDAYLNAIENPAEPEEHYQSLITHKDFYCPPNTVFFVDHIGPTLGLPRNGSGTPTLRGYRFFPNRREYAEESQSIHANIQRFLNNFDDRLSASETLSQQLSSSRLVVVALPIVRSYFDTPVEDAAESEVLGTPGGTLFVFARLGEHVADVATAVRSLARGLTNIILRGALRDSFSSIERDEIEQKSIAGAYSFAHPLKNRLGILSQAIEQLSDRIPEEYVSERDHLRATARSAHLFAEQANLIHFAIIRGADALRDPNEPYSSRYMTREPIDIVDTILGAMPDVFGPIMWPAVQIDGTGNPQVRPYRLKDHPNLEPMRIKDEFYVQIFFELINNAILHGLEVDSRVHIRWRVSDEDFGGAVRPAFILTNEWAVAPSSQWQGLNEEIRWMPVQTSSPSGLQFVSNTLSETGSGSIATMTNPATREFSVALFFSGLALIKEIRS